MDTYRFVSTGSDNHLIVSGDHYVVKGYYVSNKNILAPRYLHLYNGNPGSVPIKWTVDIPIESGANPSWQNGLHFDTAIGMALSTSPVGISAVASQEVVGFIVYDLVEF